MITSIFTYLKNTLPHQSSMHYIQEYLVKGLFIKLEACCNTKHVTLIQLVNELDASKQRATKP